MSGELTIARRFRGPQRSGNGGWTAGSLAEHVLRAAHHGHPGHAGHPAAVEVTLRRPPPLERALRVEQVVAGDEGNARDVSLWLLLDGEDRVAEAREVAAALTPVERVEEDAARKAMATYRGLGSHPFPGCFACGPEREEGDGLRIFPGPVSQDSVASRWVPHPSLAEDGPGVPRVGTATTWAALDCVGGWSEDLEGRPMVLGRMTAQVDTLPVVGERHVVVGRRVRVEGRKTMTASTLYDADGRTVASAEHVWIAVDPATFDADPATVSS